MVSCKLMGGLSNTMFQIAGAHALALRNNDVSAFDLNSFVPLQGHVATKYRDNIFKRLNIIYTYNFQNFYKEPSFTYNPIPYQKDLLIHDSYLQSYKYWSGYEKETKELLDIPPIEGYHYDVTGIHVRRGDYLRFPDVHPVCPISYYNQVMKILGGKFVVCSDDIPWCRENLVGDNITYSPFDNEIDDLRLLTHCKNLIGSNSSYSFWAGYLNPNKDAVRIFPSWKQWFGPKGPSAVDMLPPEFTQIEY